MLRLDDLCRLGGPPDRGGELLRPDLGAADQDPLRPALGDGARPSLRRRTPCASSSAAVIRVTEDLPLVPTTWIEAKRCCGMPSSAFSLCIRSSPSFHPIGSSESR